MPTEVVPLGVPGRSKAERVRAMFTRIVPRYDLMNKIMTMGLDRAWRRAAVRAAMPRGALALDVGTGTGDLAIELAQAGARQVIGADFCEEMLRAARAKVQRRIADGALAFVVGDALSLPFPDATFDCVVNGFLLRNVASLSEAFAEMSRVLRPGGRLVCLEITHPPSSLAPFFSLYFNRVVPLLGAVFTGEAGAYQYLPRSLGPLPEASHLAAMIAQAGFVDVRYRRLGLGTVALHIGKREEKLEQRHRPRPSGQLLHPLSGER
ncbi:MAG TPA: ubiquinone/menaquinone biosynthesis methyltransferase [Chloroflexota bacterium]|nr:ubiquinone/menaquinone biosynthesis methyltransferase [Chloroflexota bacterium]